MDTGSIKDKKIFELTEVLEETNGRNNQEVIVIDGRGYEKNIKPKDLYDAVSEESNHKSEKFLNEEIVKQAMEIAEKKALELVPEIAEKIARELIPQIAEKIIREEIEKLKKLSGNQ